MSFLSLKSTIIGENFKFVALVETVLQARSLFDSPLLLPLILDRTKERSRLDARSTVGIKIMEAVKPIS